MTQKNPDVLVVGAGSAGAAVSAMLASQGRRVALVDWRRSDEAGARWSNGIPGWMFDRAGLARPEPPECQRAGAHHTAVLCDADGTATIHVPADPLLHVDMRQLVARLQGLARDAGVEITQERVVDVERRGARLRRVTLAAGQQTRVLEPALTVDASGMSAAVRRRLPLLQDLCPALRPEDICVAAQYQFRVADPAGATAFLDRHGAKPGDAISFLGIAGGYSVLMVGVTEDFSEVAVLCGSVPATGVPSGATVVERFARSRRWIGERLVGGQGEIPLGPPCVRLSSPGVALLGNAAHMVYGLHGSGVGMGFLAARLLADNLRDADDPGDPDRLHRYACAFLRRYGGRLAAADLFRRFSQTLSRSDLTALMASGVVNAKMMSAGLQQAPFAANTLEPGDVLSGLRRAPRPLLSIAPVGLRMMAVQQLYPRYPQTADAKGIARFDRLARRLQGA